ncbi:MAG: hypothetical protein RI958_2835 [Actinomycetota bacterium]|jgi:Flp pilus assembly protein TadG
MTAAASPDRGLIGIALALTVAVTLGGAALVVDGGRAMTARRHAAATAEAAARWAVADQPVLAPFDPARARAAAVAHAARAGIAGGDITVTVRGTGARPEVRVTVTERRRSVFLVLLAVPEMTVTASGAATVVWEP